jgi:hypothetical protein
MLSELRAELGPAPGLVSGYERAGWVAHEALNRCLDDTVGRFVPEKQI